MAVQSPDAKHLEGVGKLVELLELDGVEIVEVLGRSPEPRELGGVQPEIFGMREGLPVIGYTAAVDELTKDATKRLLSRLTEWAQANQAKLYFGQMGKPGKGFHGVEVIVQLEKLSTSGWEVIEL
ncbi:MAG TPA: hypothetical protein VD902_19440 [Symbiobacteriaceae bacterium]|nr:hypothetical protein [Symbiobacteriaceae bacterium]